jgi:VWFA-related protein
MLALLAILAMLAMGSVPVFAQAPPPFRSGTNVIRVDATVIDRSGRAVTSLTAEDFEVREDGVLRPITSFTFLSNSGEPSDDRSLPIRSQQHAAAEAARDDVRVFLVFWDEYHIGPFEDGVAAKSALTRAMLSAFGPTDLVAIMDPLTPSSAIEFTRDRRALADRVHLLQGRRGVYLPPRSAAEEAQLEMVNWNPAAVEPFRNEVTASAIKAAAAHLGTLREGRKTLILVTEGFGVARSGTDFGPGGRGIAPLTHSGWSRLVDDQNTAMDIVHLANDTNTAVHIIDPRGLRVAGSAPAMLETLASGSGGELHQSNDISEAVQRIVGQTSATYLLGYTREMLHDGRFHEIKVRVKRRGYDVRSRAGYWAPKPGDVEKARTAAAAAVLPEAVGAAFAALTPANSSRLVETWIGVKPLSTGRSRITVAWAPLRDLPAGVIPADLSVAVKSAETLVEGRVQPGGTSFEVPDGAVQLTIRVLDRAGEVVDRETRSVTTRSAEDRLWLTAVVHRAASPAEARLLAASDPPIYAGREFLRTDRLLIRIHAYGKTGESVTLTGRLIDRRGATLLPLAISGSSPGWQLDLPLASIAPGDFAVVFEAQSGGERTETVVPLRVRR